MDNTFDWLDNNESVVMSNYRVFVPCATCKRSVIINTTCQCQPKENTRKHIIILMVSMCFGIALSMVVA